MINEEIVTYLKGEEKFKDDYFIFEWAKYSSLIKKDKDPGQYLPYLFIIYYFGPNEMIQDAAKKLIDDISPKEILQFQENFIEIVKKIGNDIAGLRLASEKEDWCFDEIESRGGFDIYENLDGYNKDNSTLELEPEEESIIIKSKELKKNLLLINDTYSWIETYLEVLFLPINILNESNLPIDERDSPLKIKLDEPKYTFWYIY